MPIPAYGDLMLPVLRHAAEKVWKMSDLVARIADELSLSQEEREITIPSGNTLLIASRVHWAKTYLKHAELVEQPKRGLVKATNSGLKLLDSSPSQITIGMLQLYPSFVNFVSGGSKAKSSVLAPSPISSAQVGVSTPEEQIEQAAKLLDVTLRDDLLQRILESTPAFFERLILDLLLAMGYGGSQAEAAEHVGQAGDGGIDGVINEDKLGLDRVYLQAKRYKPSITVGAPAVQSFIGALVNKGAHKGILITTSSFSSSAVSAAKSAGSLRLVLIDGEELARLMIKFDVGVRISRLIALKRVDLDYFDQTAGE